MCYILTRREISMNVVKFLEVVYCLHLYNKLYSIQT